MLTHESGLPRLLPVTRLALLAATAAFLATCSSSTSPGPGPGGMLTLGTWGGENSGVIATDSVTHVHVACTYGDMPGGITLDATGRFTVDGSYLLRAYPVAVGPTMPAQFSGHVEGNTLTLAIAVNDTVQKKVVALGPVTVTWGKVPQLGPCPICSVTQLRERMNGGALPSGSGQLPGRATQVGRAERE